MATGAVAWQIASWQVTNLPYVRLNLRFAYFFAIKSDCASSIVKMAQVKLG